MSAGDYVFRRGELQLERYVDMRKWRRWLLLLALTAAAPSCKAELPVPPPAYEFPAGTDPNEFFAAAVRETLFRAWGDFNGDSLPGFPLDWKGMLAGVYVPPDKDVGCITIAPDQTFDDAANPDLYCHIDGEEIIAARMNGVSYMFTGAFENRAAKGAWMIYKTRDEAPDEIEIIYLTAHDGMFVGDALIVAGGKTTDKYSGVRVPVEYGWSGMNQTAEFWDIK